MKTPQIECLVDNHRGIYLPQSFAKRYRSETQGVKADQWDVLLSGPQHDDFWDVWDEVLNRAILTLNGQRYVLNVTENGGDLMGIPESWEWSDLSGSFRPPESETLRRYILPSYWACYLTYGTTDGLAKGEAESIDAFLEREGLNLWTLGDVLESGFHHSNDANCTGGDCAEYTFVLIR